jgi:hypothetical protein
MQKSQRLLRTVSAFSSKAHMMPMKQTMPLPVFGNLPTFNLGLINQSRQISTVSKQGQ